MRYNLILLSLLLLSFAASAQTDKAPTSPVARPVTSYQSIVGNDTSYYAYQNGAWFQLVGRAYAKAHYAQIANQVNSGLVTTISGTTATTTAGTWVINGNSYGKTTPTNTTIPTQDATLSRFVVIYVDTLNAVHGINGALSSDPIIPSTPINTLAISIISITPTSVTNAPVAAGFVTYNNSSNQNLNMGSKGVQAANFVATGTVQSRAIQLVGITTPPITPSAGAMNLWYQGNNLVYNKADGFKRTLLDANTADRVYTLPDKNGTVAMLSDIGGGGGPYVRQSQLFSLTTPNIIGDTVSQVTELYVDPLHNQFTIEGGTMDDNNAASIYGYDKGLVMQFQYGDRTKQIDMRNTSDSTIRVENDNNAGISYFQKPNFALSTDHLMFASTGYADSVATAHGGGSYTAAYGLGLTANAFSVDTTAIATNARVNNYATKSSAEQVLNKATSLGVVNNTLYPTTQAVSTALASKQNTITVLPIANGGTGTATPSIVAGTNISITGAFPNQTINASGGGSSYTASNGVALTGTNFTADTTFVKSKAGALIDYNNLKSGVVQVYDNPTPPALTGYTTNVAVAYGTIRLYPAATKAFNLRRSSDNAVQDFYFDSNGKVKQDDITKWLDGNVGYLTTWYDQSGNGINAAQATAASQPYVVFENGICKVRFQNLYATTTGESLSYTLGTAVNDNNTTIFCAYASLLTSGSDVTYPTPNFQARYLLSSNSTKLDLFINGADASKPNVLTLGTASTSTLFAATQNNFFAINSTSGGANVRSNYGSASISAVTSQSETQFKIGNKYASDVNPFAGDVYAYVQYSTAQAGAVVDTLAARLKVPYSLRGNSDNTVNVAIIGDSETAGNKSTNNQTWSKQTNFINSIPTYNFGITTNTYAFQNTTINNASVDGQIVAGKTNVLVVWLGTNDLSGAATTALTATQTYNAAVSYAQARHTAGWNKVIELTALDRGSIGTWATFNTMLKANTTDFDAVLDVAGDPRLQGIVGFGGSTTSLSQPNSAYFSSDYIHLTNAGYRVVSGYVDAYIESLSPIASAQTTLARKVKELQDQLNDLQRSAILNNVPIQSNSTLGVQQIYTPNISSGQNPLGNLTINANSPVNASNTGNILINSTGAGRVAFGSSTFPLTTSAYTFSYSSAPTLSGLTIDFYNPNNTNTSLNFLQNGPSRSNASYIEAGNGSTGTLHTYSLQATTLESNQNNINLKTNGSIGLSVATIPVGGTYYPMVGLYGHTAPTSFLDMPIGLAGVSGSVMKFHTGVTQQTVLEQGAVNWDGTNLFIASGTTPVNQQVAYVANLYVASSDLTAQSAANTSVATYTTTAIGTFRIGGYVNITAVAVDVIEMQVTYTDENSNVQTVNFFNQGATSALLSAIGNSVFPPMDIRCKTGTSITVKTTLTTGSGSITYDAGATITKLR